MKMEKERLGDLFIIGEAVLWGLFPIVTQLTYGVIAPLPALAWTEMFAAIFFATIITVRRGWKELADRAALKEILLATFFIGIVFYALTFIGLQYTSAGNVSLIQLTEIFFSYLLFNLFRGERFPRVHLFGAGLVIAGACIVLFPNVTAFHVGDFLILAAAATAPFGNLFQQHARRVASSESIMFIRSIISAVFIGILAFAFKQDIVPTLSVGIVLLLALNGVFLLGLSKILWIEGIHRISVTRANALSGISPLFTLLFVYMIIGNAPTVWQLTAFVPMFFGVLLMSAKVLPRER